VFELPLSRNPPVPTDLSTSRDQQGAIRKKTPSLCALTGNSPHLQAALLSPGVCDLPCGMSLQARIVSAHFDSHQRVISAVRLTSLGLSALIIIGLPSRRELRRDRRSHPTDDFRRIRLLSSLLARLERVAVKNRTLSSSLPLKAFDLQASTLGRASAGSSQQSQRLAAAFLSPTSIAPCGAPEAGSTFPAYCFGTLTPQPEPVRS
jgi:hypothetical protein